MFWLILNLPQHIVWGICGSVARMGVHFTLSRVIHLSFEALSLWSTLRCPVSFICHSRPCHSGPLYVAPCHSSVIRGLVTLVHFTLPRVIHLSFEALSLWSTLRCPVSFICHSRPCHSGPLYVAPCQSSGCNQWDVT